MVWLPQSPTVTFATGFTGPQSVAEIAALADGGFVAIWFDPGAAGNGLRGRLVLPDGTAAGGEFRLDDAVGTITGAPSVTVLEDGRIAVAWTRIVDGEAELAARILDTDGSLAEAAFALSTGTTGLQGQTALAATPGGGFLAAWSAGDPGAGLLWTRHFDGDGQGTNAPVLAGSLPALRQINPALIVLEDGGYALSWDNAQDDRNILLRTFNADGSPKAPEAIATSNPFGSQTSPAMTQLSDGSFGIVWQSNASGVGVIMARHFSSDGTAMGDDVIVAVSVNGQANPCLVALPDGGFAVVWDESVDGNQGDVFLRLFSDDFVAVGQTFDLQPTDSVDQGQPDIAVLADGRLGVLWRDAGNIHGRVLDIRLLNDAPGNDTITGRTDAPRLLANGDTMTVDIAASIIVAHQHALQSASQADLSVGITVSGRIEAVSDYGSFDAIHLRGMASAGQPTGEVTVMASGIVKSAGGVAISFAGGSNLITNEGRIEGKVTAILGGTGTDHVVNSGQIIGDVRLGAGNDVYDERGGQISGLIFGGTGDDSYFLSAPDPQIIEAANAGTDTVTSSASHVLGAHIEHLMLTGTGNLQGTGNDVGNRITGNAGVNFLTGLAGADSLYGGAGSDILTGGAGNDSLSGGSGSDRLTGGTGRDVLTGGASRDVFIFLSGTDSPAKTRDTITDFRTGQDDIDLSSLSPRKIAFRGTDEFTRGAAQVRFDVTKAQTTVQVDVNGDGRADLTIKLLGAGVLTAGDFIL